MSRKRTDFRALKARRDAAMARPELSGTRAETVIVDEVEPMIKAAIAAGRITKVPPGKKGRQWKSR